MYRVDKYGHVRSKQGFPFPAVTTVYFTGSGGLHFWVELADAVAYTRENGLSHFFACPRILENAHFQWSRDFMDEQRVHVVPTLVMGVDGYPSPRKMRDELVLPGYPPMIYRSALIKISA